MKNLPFVDIIGLVQRNLLLIYREGYQNNWKVKELLEMRREQAKKRA